MSMSKNYKSTNVLILSAGSVGPDIASIFGVIPSGMVPINSKPAIAWIIDSLLDQGFEKYFATVGFKKELLEQFLSNAYGKRCAIECIAVDHKLAPGNAIVEALPKIESNDLLVILGDTIVQGNVELDGSFVYTSPQFDEPTKWCLVRQDAQGKIKEVFDKQDLSDTKDLLALIGVYYFKDVNLLREVSRDFNFNQKIQISALLERYRAKDAIRCIEQKGWIDIGHLDRYHKAKIRLVRPRQFNQLEYDTLRGVIRKRSKDTEKLRDEIQWYQHVPDDLKILAPRVLEARIDQDPYITMEYYGYPTLSELMVYGAIHPTIWKQIVEKLVKVANLFLAHKGRVTQDDYEAMYIKKTKERITRSLEQNPGLKELSKHPIIEVNGHRLHNIVTLLPFVETKVQELYQGSEFYNCFLHGDFCFSNILFDCASGVVRLIDPRGRWGATPYGDIRYDLAKLRHSIAGKYDYIINDLFTIEQKDNAIVMQVHANPAHKEVEVFFDDLLKKDWNLDQIKFVEGLLFLSMIPLHTERKDRQLAMFATGLERLNEVYDSRT